MGRYLVQFISVCGLIEAFDSQIASILCEGASWKDLHKFFKTALGSLVVTKFVVAKGCEILHGILLWSPLIWEYQSLKEVCRLFEFSFVVVVKCSLHPILRIGTLHKGLIVVLTGVGG